MTSSTHASSSTAAAATETSIADGAESFTIAEVVGLPAARARRDPHGPSLSSPTVRIDNAGFAAAVAGTAKRLEVGGIGRGSVVGVLLRNAPEIIVTMFATWSMGAALTPINPALTDDEVVFQIEDSGCSLLVGGTRAEAIAGTQGIEFVSIDETCFAPPAPCTDAACVEHGRAECGHDRLGVRSPSPNAVATSQPEDTALIVYTSGTTGKPKGCLLDQANVAAMVWSLVNGLDFGAAPRSLLVLPLFHCNGLIAGTIAPLVLGGSVHVLPKFDPRTFWDVVETERPSYFSAVPTIFSILEARASMDVDASSLRFVICGAAPMAKNAIARFEDKFDVDMVEGYGLSECTVCATLNRNDGTARPGTVGPPLPGFEIGIRDPEGSLLPAGESGEVVISSKTIMRGYLGRPEATAEVLRDGWLYTGDVGFIDADGYLTLVDRIKDLIIRGGENIYPKEIEDALLGHDQVVEAAVVGAPDEKYGETVIAYVALREGATTTEEELQAFLEPRLARYKLPTTINLRAELPKNSVGKIVKGELRSA